MRAAMAMLCVACAGEAPLPEDHYVDLDVVLATWQDCLALLDHATAEQPSDPVPQEPSPARDTALLAAFTTLLAQQRPSLRSETSLVPTWGPRGSLDLHADLDGDRSAGPGEPLVASLAFDTVSQQIVAVDEEHPSLVRTHPLPPSFGQASAYAYGRMAAEQGTQAQDPSPVGPIASQPAGYHASLPAR